MVSPYVYVAAVPVSLVVALGLLRRWKASKWGQCTSTTNLRGKTFLVTGANSGIGLETAKALVKRNARVIFACRDIGAARQRIAEIRNVQPKGGELIPLELDLASFTSIEKFVELVKAGFARVDVLINNAGVAIPLKNDMKTKEGFEINMGVNHLGHFYLTNLLVESLKKAAPSRVVIVASTLFEKGKINLDDLNMRKEIEMAKKGQLSSRSNPGYSNSKLMNTYFGRALADKWQKFNIRVHTCCPGFTYTSLFRHSFKWYHYVLIAPILFFYMRSATQGAQTVLHCATSEELDHQTGQFYRDCKLYKTEFKFDPTVEQKLWEASEEMIKQRKPITVQA